MAEITKTLTSQADWQAAIVQYLTDLTTTPGDALIDTPAAGRHTILTNIVNMGSKPLAKGRFSRNVTLQNEIISQRIGYARGAWYQILTSQANWEGFSQKKENIDTATTPGDVVLAANPTPTVIDNMEYANDAAAQAAWVTSKGPSYLDEFDDDVIDPHLDKATANNGTVVELGGKITTHSPATTDGSIIKTADADILGTAAFDFRIKAQVAARTSGHGFLGLMHDTWDGNCGTGATQTAHGKFSIYFLAGFDFRIVYFDVGGGAHWWSGIAWVPDAATGVTWLTGTDYVFRFIKTGNVADTDTIQIIVYAADGVTPLITCDPVLLEDLQHTTGKVQFYAGDFRTESGKLDMEFDYIDGLYLTDAGALQCYSDDVEEQQGTYCLKVVADQTDSLNERIERDLGGGGTIDMTGWAILELWIRATRGGQHIRFWFGEANYNENSFDLYIEVADTWQKVYIDISDIADGDKDAVRYLAFEITNDDEDTIYYLDAFIHPGYGYQRNTIDFGEVPENDVVLSVVHNIPASTSLIYVAAESSDGITYGPTREISLVDDSGAMPTGTKRRYWRIGCIHDTAVWPTVPTQYSLTLDWFAALVDLSLNELTVLPYQYVKIQVRLETNTGTSPALHSYTFTFINSYDLYIKKVKYKCSSGGIKVDMSVASADPEPVNPVVALQQQLTEDRGTQEITHRSGIALCYGELWVKGNAGATAIGTAGVYVQMLAFANNGPFNYTTPDHTNDHIVIDVAGNYFIVCTFCIEKTAGTEIVLAIDIRKNNGTVIYNNLHAHKTLLGGGGDIRATTISGIIPSLVKTDTVEIWVANETNTENIIFEAANMTIHRVI